MCGNKDWRGGNFSGFYTILGSNFYKCCRVTYDAGHYQLTALRKATGFCD